MPIRTKLTLWYSALVAAILILLAILRYAGQQKLLLEKQDYSLKVVADILDSSLSRKIPSKETAQKAVARMVLEYPDIELKGFIIELYDPFQALIFSSSLTEKGRLPLSGISREKAAGPHVVLQTATLGKKEAPIRLLMKPVYHQEKMVYLILIGSSMEELTHSLENLTLLNLIFIPAAVVLISLGGWLLTRRALSPLGAVIRSAQRISSGDLSHRIGVEGYSEEIRELTEAFNRMVERLEVSFRQVQEFSDNVSHELRIPLSILHGQTEVALRRARSEVAYRDVLRSNLEEIQRMEGIVERLLFLSKAERGEVPLDFKKIALRNLTEAVAEQFSMLAREKNVSVTVVPGDPYWIEGDEVLLRELTMNLVQNAVANTPAGGKVALSLSGKQEGVELSVTDTGSGIPPEDIPHIFERFYQVDRSRSGQGSGLGLSLCRWIAQAHGGGIRVESTVGKGSRFSILFPTLH